MRALGEDVTGRQVATTVCDLVISVALAGDNDPLADQLDLVAIMLGHLAHLETG